MAAMLASRKALFPSLFHKLAFPRRSAAAAQVAFRSFNANAQLDDLDDDEDPFMGISQAAKRSPAHRSRLGDFGRAFFPGSNDFDPFYPSRRLSQALNWMDRMFENPFQATARGTGDGRSIRGFDVKEDNESLSLRLDMPGLGKEDVQVLAEHSTLVIKGGSKETEDEASGRKYSRRIDLPTERYEMEGIKAEMKNGVLKVLVPKVKEGERKDAFHVTVE